MAASHLIPCPYDPNNPNHASLPGTFGYHLVKCRASIVTNKEDPRRPRVLKLTKCQYNNTHIVLKTELEEHHKSCPTKIDADVEDITERIRRNLQASKIQADKKRLEDQTNTDNLLESNNNANTNTDD